MEFPRYFENSEGYSWADFRIGLPNKPNDWVAKLYTRDPSLKFVNQVTQENGDVVKTFKPEYERIVALARWNAPNLLEVRITRCESRDKLRMRLHGIWKKLSPALKQELDFIEWDVRSIRKKMLESRRENETIFTTGSLQLTDSQSGKIIVHPNTPEEEADDADERSAAIDAVLGDNRCVCDHLAITYLQSGSSNVLERDLRVSIGGRYDHEILVSAQASLQAVDYVTNQLRSFE